MQTKGVPYLSHPFARMWKSKAKAHPLEVVTYVDRLRQKEAEGLIKQMQDSTLDSLRDEFMMAGLKVIKDNSILKGLVDAPAIINRPELRKNVKDYSGVNFTSAKPHVTTMMQTMLTGGAKKALNRMMMDADILIDAMGIDLLRLKIAMATAARTLKSLEIRRVKETELRGLILALIDCGLLRQSRNMFIWCDRCDEWGVVASIVSVLPPSKLPPYCPACGRVAFAMGVFRPLPPLIDAIQFPDGLLGAAIGWHFKMNGVRFDHGVDVGGEECDFITRGSRRTVLFECKMNFVLSAEDSMRATLLENRKQLVRHINLAKAIGVKLTAAACVLNLRRDQLRGLAPGLKPESDPEYNRLGGMLVSYEDFPKCVQKLC